MIKAPALLIAIGYGLIMWLFSAWRLKRQMDETSTPLDVPALDPMLAAMAKALEVEQIKVHVHEVEPINGMAMADGRIFLTRGFLDKLDTGDVTPDELASVIAHELGHVQMGHTRRRIIDFAAQNAIREVLLGTFGRVLPGIGTKVANTLARMVSKRLSREDEYEADAFASALMVKAGLGTAPQKALFRKLNALTGKTDGGAPAWLMSHPSTDDRISAIEANEAKWRIT